MNYLNLAKFIEGKTLPPLSKEIIEEVRSKIEFSEEMADLLLETNGLFHEKFKIFPLFDAKNTKISWDSLERANNIETTKFSVSQELLKDFVIFAELEGLTCAMMSKEDGKIWYEDDEGFHRTTLNLEKFIIDASKE